MIRVVTQSGFLITMGVDLVVDNSGNVYIACFSVDYIAIKLDSCGIEQWIERYDGPIHSTDQSGYLYIDKFGNVYVTGWSYGLSQTPDFLTVKYNPIGEEEWVTRYNGYENDEARGISVDDSANVYVIGESCLRGIDYYSKDWSVITIIKYTQTPTSIQQPPSALPCQKSLLSR
jgi:hypothetical protein